MPAPCPYFGRCGGCHYQHAPYDHQVEAKCAILVEELRRLGKIEPPEEIAVITGEPWGYRNRVQFHVEKRPSWISGSPLPQALRHREMPNRLAQNQRDYRAC